ncbi:hypothetical protein KPH14_008493 [Odynerus spinipes]|uniref:Reverse transcriptase/retrotransposon-derived protein RNase H-like domain-containing protein n=1 Tax=Odynerus spinipes TaxID=1348599 RepID=A0AAD9VLP8_9HYME|nr:hypothetical protein KPH14_008493 [Odynerus spinipes]
MTLRPNIDLGYSVKPARFDGNSSWEEYKIQFQTIAQINGWDEPKKSLALVSSLEGFARSVLTTLSVEKHTDWNAFVPALEFKYGTKNLANLSYLMFQNYKQRKEQSLSDLASENERLAQNAFSDCPMEMRDKLAASYETAHNSEKKAGKLQEVGVEGEPPSSFQRAPVVLGCSSGKHASIEGVVAGKRNSIILDTGSRINLLRAGIFGSGDRSSTTGIQEANIYSISGERLPVLGKGRFKIEFGNFTGKEDFFLVDMLEECILGNDFFFKHSAQLDFSTSELRIPGQGVCFKNGNVEKRVKVVLSKISELMPPHFQALFERSSGSLSDDQRRSFAGLLKEIGDVFARIRTKLDNATCPGGPNLKSFEEELNRLREVFILLRHAGLLMSTKKCNFFCREVQYLGHVVSEQEVKTDPSKISAVREWPVPKDKSQVRSFIGLCTYYRKFTEECQQAFEHLKKCLAESHVLAYPLTDAEFILDTDA